jgi:predicted tellurium resistance membrane protein TerC
VVLKLVERFPVIIQLGAAVLAFTAAKMVVHEPWLVNVFGTDSGATDAQSMTRWALYALAIAAVLGAGWWSQKRFATAERSAH